MGTSIDIEVEVLHQGRWWNHLLKFHCCFCDPDSFNKLFEKSECRYCGGTTFRSNWNTRNYFVFAMLGVGALADMVPPIAPTRGLPKDASPEIRSMAYGGLEDEDGEPLFLGDDDRSYLTLTELLAYDWEAQVMDADDPPARPLRVWAGDFYNDYLPALKKLCEDKGKTTDEVRIVFGFDH